MSVAHVKFLDKYIRHSASLKFYKYRLGIRNKDQRKLCICVNEGKKNISDIYTIKFVTNKWPSL